MIKSIELIKDAGRTEDTVKNAVHHVNNDQSSKLCTPRWCRRKVPDCVKERWQMSH